MAETDVLPRGSGPAESRRREASAARHGSRLRSPSLGTKFFVAAGLLVLATLGTAIAVAAWRSSEVAAITIRRDLRRIPEVFAAYERGFESQLRATLRSTADEAGTKSILDPGVSLETVHDWAGQKAAVLGARTVFLFDRSGALLVRSDRLPGEATGQQFRAVKWVSDPIDHLAEASATIREGKVLSTIAAVPVLAGDVDRGEARLQGVLAASMPFDASRATAVRGLTGGQVCFVANVAKRGEPPRLSVASGPEGGEGDALVSALSKSPDAIGTLFMSGREVGPLDIRIGGERRIVAGVPLASASGETLGALVVSRSRDEETAAFSEIRSSFLVIGLAVLAVSIPVSFALARRIVRPLQQLAGGALAIREGNLDVTLPEAGSDEVGTLARAFGSMLSELKEKAQLEDLLADMNRRAAEPLEPSASLGDTDPGRAPKPGRLFASRYQIISLLGKGGMGSVFRAYDRELEEDVALKVLTREAFGASDEAIQSLKQEIRVARRISHPNVARTHDLGEADGIHFLTMEYIAGRTLRELIEGRDPIALAPGIQIAKQLCRGLAAVHEAGIIHRDIKPQNIMVLPNGVVKLMDFGIARTAEGSDKREDTLGLAGTPFYMSPEQASGEELDARSDIYCVGVLLFELFTGAKPFIGNDAFDVIFQHRTKVPPRPSDLRPGLPAYLEQTILSCLEKDRSRRPAGANDIYLKLMSVES